MKPRAISGACPGLGPRFSIAPLPTRALRCRARVYPKSSNSTAVDRGDTGSSGQNSAHIRKASSAEFSPMVLVIEIQPAELVVDDADGPSVGYFGRKLERWHVHA